MDFFAAQDKARSTSRLLVFYFILAVIGIVLAVYATAMFLFANPAWVAENGGVATDTGFAKYWDLHIFTVSAGGTIISIAIASLLKASQLRVGGGFVATMLGGRKILPGTNDPDEQRLMNVVEEMAIASGVAAPEVYVLDDEDSINGFAAGLTLQDAAITVTAGCMKKLSRDELQGVIAHEYSHIVNSDMRLNVRLIGLLFGILFLSVIGSMLMRTAFHASRSSRDSKNGGGPLLIFALGVSLYIIGSIGVFFGRLIQCAVSRQREFLADAAAVQFTRNPEGIAGALRKIAHDSSTVRHPEAQEVAHFFFANGLSLAMGGWLATHPPITARIKAILPNWDGDLAKPISASSQVRPEAKQPVSSRNRNTVGPTGVLRRTGALDHDSLQHSIAIRAAIAATLLDAAHSTDRAAAVAFCLALDSNGDVRRKQLDFLRTALTPDLYAAVVELSPSVAATKDRMALLEMTVPALKSASQLGTRYGSVLADVAMLADGSDVFPWLVAIYLRSLRNSPFHCANTETSKYQLPAACGRLFVRLAECSTHDRNAKAEVLRAATASFTAAFIKPVSPDDYPKSFVDLELSLLRLRREVPHLKKAVLETGAAIVLHDDIVNPDEQSVLQLFALIMETPLPPLN